VHKQQLSDTIQKNKWQHNSPCLTVNPSLVTVNPPELILRPPVMWAVDEDIVITESESMLPATSIKLSDDNEDIAACDPIASPPDPMVSPPVTATLPVTVNPEITETEIG
jgi:hypothetical protein